MLQALTEWLETPVFAIDRRAKPRGREGIVAVPENASPSADQIGFFRVAGLIRTLLAILVPAMMLQAIVLNLMIKDRVRDGIDGLKNDVVSVKEFNSRKEETDRRYLELEAADRELRERIVALEQKVRLMELDEARGTAKPRP